MIYIAHRGNTSGPDELANEPSHVLAAFDQGYDAEVDLWVVKFRWMLGHNEPQYEVDAKFIEDHADHLLIHCKNAPALHVLRALSKKVHYFWHEKDRFTLTSKGFVFARPGEAVGEHSIVVMPELAEYADERLKLCYAICSDRIKVYKERLGQ